MLLNEIEVAERLKIPVDGLSDSGIKKRVRAVIRKAGVVPYVPERGIWLVSEERIPFIMEKLCPLKSSKGNSKTERDQKLTGYVEPSKELRFSNLQKKLESAKLKNSGTTSKPN